MNLEAPLLHGALATAVREERQCTLFACMQGDAKFIDALDELIKKRMGKSSVEPRTRLLVMRHLCETATPDVLRCITTKTRARAPRPKPSEPIDQLEPPALS
eukprot:TRINITY_DN29867_c0_g1_i1.p2 TRINITY_DN29867_c0_g1~~TRINITY_DN29867_c0_g1_i1.p2  ORF type:complete len:119 (+),score=50.52 TRINITY_DN29867_c0_g1_i1:53-358(+)